MGNTVIRVKSAKANYDGFESAYENLPGRVMTSVRRELQDRLDWSPSCFYYKRRGDSPLRENELPVLKEVFERYGIDYKTGDRIN